MSRPIETSRTGVYGDPSQSLSHQPPPLHPPPHLPPLASAQSRSSHTQLPPLKPTLPHGSGAAPPPSYPSAYRYVPSDPRDTTPIALKSVAMSSASPCDDESGSEDEKEKEKHKLEVRRVKNRVKQRNLRMRRANHISELENNITTLRGEHASLQSTFSALQQREAHLESWLRDLESALFRHGLSGEVDAIRRAYSAISSPEQTKRAKVTSDPLSTLPQAALAPDPPEVGVGPRDRPTSRESEPEEKKRKRDSDGRACWKTDRPTLDPPRRVSVSIHERTREHFQRRLPAGNVSPMSADRVNPPWRSASAAPTHPRPGSSSSHLSPPEWAAPSPRFIRLEDLLSPMAPPMTSLRSHEPPCRSTPTTRMTLSASASVFSGEAETEEPRRWSVGEASVVDNVLGGGDVGESEE